MLIKKSNKLGVDLGASRRSKQGSHAATGVLLCIGGSVCIGGGSVLAEEPAATQSGIAPNSSSNDSHTLPQESFFSSLKQAFRKDFDHEAVRGHFDLGTPPNAHRYFCLVDPKTGKKEPNGVLGHPVPMAGGMTGIKDSSVSLYRCDDAEKQGLLVTSPYDLSAGPKSTAPPAAASAALARGTEVLAAAPATLDVAGVKLGMSPDEVRAILKSKQLADFAESTESLYPSSSADPVIQPLVSGRFVNVIATWTRPWPPAVDHAVAADRESYEVMFTPVPGKERAMAIVHTVGYAAANGIVEMSLNSALIKKYGGFATPHDLPASATWRLQSGGEVQVGDSCNRRAIFAAPSASRIQNFNEQNLALITPLEELRFQMDRCGIAIVTEDHSIASGGAPGADGTVTQFTVTAYSPSIGLDGASAAAQLLQASAAPGRPATAPQKSALKPNL